jgi:hypothetical protein
VGGQAGAAFKRSPAGSGVRLAMARGGHTAAKPVNGGHVHRQVLPVESFHRARGGQRRGQGGTPFGASSRLN